MQMGSPRESPTHAAPLSVLFGCHSPWQRLSPGPVALYQPSLGHGLGFRSGQGPFATTFFMCPPCFESRKPSTLGVVHSTPVGVSGWDQLAWYVHRVLLRTGIPDVLTMYERENDTAMVRFRPHMLCSSRLRAWKSFR